MAGALPPSAMRIPIRDMNKRNVKAGFDDIESRRSAASRRRMTPMRRLYYFLGLPVLLGISRLLWWSYRKEIVIGADVAERMIADGNTYAPCYWHQHGFCCLQLMREWLARGFRAGFIISASVDGEVPARIARSWGADIVRGSAKQTNALAMRDIQQAMKRGVSIVTAADGPLGPAYHFKPGVVLMARIGSAPLVPIACTADHAWYFRRWDRFMLPKPFARVHIAVGEPLPVSRDTRVEDLEPLRETMENAINSLIHRSEKRLGLNG